MANLYRSALALLDDVALAGLALELTRRGIDPTGPLPVELGARLEAFLGRAAARHATTARGALLRLLRAPTLAAREMLTLDLECARLPVPYDVRFSRRGVQANLTTRRVEFERARAAGEAVFAVGELWAAGSAALVWGAGPAELDGWLARKGTDERLVLTHGAVRLAPVPAGRTAVAPDLTFGEWFDLFDCELVDVAFEAPTASEAAA